MYRDTGKECALMLIYPNSDANLACDEECYFKTEEGKAALDWYVMKYPDEMNNCCCTPNKE